VLLNLNASPFCPGKRHQRDETIRRHLAVLRKPLVYINTTGAADNGKNIIPFDGESLVYDAAGRLIAIGRQFQEQLLVVDLDSSADAPAVSLSGELSQSERNHALQALRDGRARVCVATDVAARGIDLPNLDLVIHAELPNDAEVLQHRSGRTGRAGRKGISILLVPPSRRRRAEEMLGRARVNAVWGNAPSADEIRKLDQERLMQSAILTEPGSEDAHRSAGSGRANR